MNGQAVRLPAMDGQLRLEGFSSATMPDRIFSNAESKGFFTAERFKSQRPDDYAAIVQLLAENVPVKQIARAFRPCSRNTVAAIRAASAGTIEHEKESTRRRAQRLKHKLIDSIEEDLDAGKLEGRDKVIALGVIMDKEAGLSGVSVTINIGSGSQRDQFESMRRAAGAFMGIGDGKTEQRREAIQGEQTRNEHPDARPETDAARVIDVPLDAVSVAAQVQQEEKRDDGNG